MLWAEAKAAEVYIANQESFCNAACCSQLHSYTQYSALAQRAPLGSKRRQRLTWRMLQLQQPCWLLSSQQLLCRKPADASAVQPAAESSGLSVRQHFRTRVKSVESDQESRTDCYRLLVLSCCQWISDLRTMQRSPCLQGLEHMRRFVGS